MKALLLLLALAPCAAQAGPWSKLAGDKESVLLLDQSSIRKDEHGRKAWTMQSYRKPHTTPDGKPYLSVRSQHLYACGDATRTPLAQLFYADVLGKGEPVATFKYEAYDAEQVAPDSYADKALKAVCKKR